MIRLNRNDLEEYIIDRKDLSLLLDRWDETYPKEHRVLLEALACVQSYEYENQQVLSDIRVQKNSNLGQLLFRRAKEEIVEDHSSEVVFSLMTMIVMNQDDALALLDNVPAMLRQQEKNPSKEMVEQVLLLRPHAFTTSLDSPFCIMGHNRGLLKKLKK